MEYRRKKKGRKVYWHFLTSCRYWPTTDFYSSDRRPQGTGVLCRRCEDKQKLEGTRKRTAPTLSLIQGAALKCALERQTGRAHGNNRDGRGRRTGKPIHKLSSE